MRSVLKTAAAYACTRTGVDDIVRRYTSRRTVPFVVCYHRVVDRRGAGRTLPAMEVQVDTLERHLDWIGRRFRVVPLDDLADALASGPSVEAGELAGVTFDDGYSDLYHHALPVLRRKGMPAAVFVVSDLIGTRDLPVHDRLFDTLSSFWLQERAPRRLGDVLRECDTPVPEALIGNPERCDPFAMTRILLRTLPQGDLLRLIAHLRSVLGTAPPLWEELTPLSWSMLADMQRAGVTVGSHTRTHPRLTNETAAQVTVELSGSRQQLEGALGVDIRHFAYPDGAFNPAVVQAVARAGYRSAFTICGHRDPDHPLLTIPRTPLWENSCVDFLGRFSPGMLSCHAAGVFDARSGRHDGCHE